MGRAGCVGTAASPLLGRVIQAMAIAALAIALGAHPVEAQQPAQWHGYVQLRYRRTDPSTGFVVRRAKLWLEGSVPGSGHLGYKVQGIFRNGASGAFVLQDVFAEYHRSGVALRFGQLVPDFSLQRAQPDYRVPLIERAAVVESLIPGARTLGREVGAEALLEPPSGWAHLALGLFNGSGANRPPGSEGDYLVTGRLIVTGDIGAGARASVGASLAWRETHGTDVGILTATTGAFAGRDVRWGTEARAWGKAWDVQGEYLHADLAEETSEGFYLLGTLALEALTELTVSVERLDVPAAERFGGPWFVAGVGRYVGSALGGAAPNASRPSKIMTDLRVASDQGHVRVGAAVQVQVFLR